MQIVEDDYQSTMAAVMPEVRNMATRRTIPDARKNILGESSRLVDMILKEACSVSVARALRIQIGLENADDNPGVSEGCLNSFGTDCHSCSE